VDWHILPYATTFLVIYVAHGDLGALCDLVVLDDRDYVLDLDVHDYLDDLDHLGVLDCQLYHLDVLDDLYRFAAHDDHDVLYHRDDFYRLDCHDNLNFWTGILLAFAGVRAFYGNHHFGQICRVLSFVDLSSCSLPY
jgi:hypothetical protein